MNKVLLILAKFLPLEKAYTHCDIPCGIYDPYLAQMAAHTVIRMTTLIEEEKIVENPSLLERKQFIHKISRLTKIKEEHAEIVKHEIRVIWGDYFKPEHLKDSPNLHELVFNILKLASKTRQEINLLASKELLESVQEFSEIFWKTKGRETVRVAFSYPTGGEVVLPK